MGEKSSFITLDPLSKGILCVFVHVYVWEILDKELSILTAVRWT